MGTFLTRWLISAISIAIAIQVIPGIDGDASGQLGVSLPTLFAVALIFGLINAIVRPIFKLLSCPFILLTLGLFTFIINALMLLLTSSIANTLGLGFYVNGFIPAFLGAIVISIVSLFLGIFVRDDKDK